MNEFMLTPKQWAALAEYVEAKCDLVITQAYAQEALNEIIRLNRAEMEVTEQLVYHRVVAEPQTIVTNEMAFAGGEMLRRFLPDETVAEGIAERVYIAMHQAKRGK